MIDKHELIFNKKDKTVIVQISSAGYNRERLAVVREYCPVDIQEQDGVLHLEYMIPEYFDVLSEKIQLAKTELERLTLAQKMTALHIGKSDFKIPYLHPDNIIISGGDVKFLHYGIEKLLSPYVWDETFYLASYKALIASILVPKVNFELAIDGLGAVKEKAAQDLLKLSSIEEINRYISEKFHALSEQSASKNTLVNKNRWKGLLIGVSVLSVATLVLGFTTYQSMFQDVPLKSAVIRAQSNFMKKDYSETVNTLKTYNAESLPKEARYVLAASYVHLDSLSDKQKEAVLNTITEATDGTILNYWIYLGRGKFEKALDLAQNIGDNQLILHAYTNLYEATKANANMNGSEKQKKLAEYEKKIKELAAEVGETSKENSKSSKGNGQ
ncbi:type VII secretion protein EssB [Streptococcus intermedius]|uniref:type VII secretion protein EssB n=1 Tax=Streptococcus intermedius TaxID=1338 RepID=UPI000E3E257B|nr:type VII secretion protein EssB [Streptococcus intermedius]